MNFETFIKELKDKKFIMSILNEDVTVDVEEEMKFICIEDVQKKFDTLAQKYKDSHTDTVNDTVKPKLLDEQLLECAKNNFKKGRQFERDKILEEFIKRILKNKSLDSRSQQIAIVHLREITGLIYREQLNSKKSLTNSSEDKND